MSEKVCHQCGKPAEFEHDGKPICLDCADLLLEPDRSTRELSQESVAAILRRSREKKEEGEGDAEKSS